MPSLSTPRPRTRLAHTAALLTASAVVLAGCSDSDDVSSPEAATTLDVAISSVVDCLDPWQADLPAAMNVMRQMGETLTWIDPETGELTPWLADSWEVNDEATEFTFTLAEGITFSDGTELTSEVMAQNYDVGSTYERSARWPSYMAGYTGTEIIDPLTFTVTFGAPNASFLNRTASQFMTVLAPASLEATPEDRCSQGYISTGPFVLDTFTANQSITLAAREDYDWSREWAGHSGAATIDEIVFAMVPESGSRIGLLTSGQADFAQGIEPQDFAAVEERGGEIVSRITPGIPLRIQANTQAFPLDSLAVRRAVAQYIDRDELNDVAFGGLNEPNFALLTPNVAGALDLEELLSYDPAAADALLEDDGWAKNSAGIWEKDGQAIEFHLTTAALYPGVPAMLEQMVAQLAQNGITMTFSDWTGDFLDMVTNYQFVGLLSNTTDIDGDVLRGQLSPLLGNRANLDDDDPLVDILDVINTTGDVETRNALIGEAQRYVVEQGYQTPILPVVQYYGIAANLTGVSYDVESRPVFYGVSLTD